MADTTTSATTSTTTAPTEIAGPTPGTQEHLVVNVGDRVFFDFDQSDLRPEARATVEALAVWMNSYPATTIALEGHADERGTREYNLALELGSRLSGGAGGRSESVNHDQLRQGAAGSSRLQRGSLGAESPRRLRRQLSGNLLEAGAEPGPSLRAAGRAARFFARLAQAKSACHASRIVGRRAARHISDKQIGQDMAIWLTWAAATM
jgi:hypothetical protein